MTPGTTASGAALPRADAQAGPTGAPAVGADPGPPEETVREGFFPYASTRLRGLPFTVWALQLYLFIGFGAIDEEWPSVGKVRPRLLLGALVLFNAVVLALERAFTTKSGLSIPHRPMAWCLAFLAASWLSTVWAYSYDLAYDAQMQHTVTLLAFVLVVAIARTRREFLVTVLVVAAGHGFFVLRSFQEWLNGKYMYTMGVVRMMGAGESYADPNSFAATIVIALPVVAWVGIRTRSKFVRFCCACYGALTSLCVVYTHSRSGLVLLCLTLLYVMFAMPRLWPKVAFGAAIFGIGVVMVAGMKPAELQRYLSLVSGDTYTKDESTTGRIDGYRVGFQMLRERPVLGVGPGNWAIYRQRKVDGSALQPHNVTGELVSSRGLLGTITFLGYLASTVLFGVREIRRRRRSASPWDRAVASFCAAVLFSLLLLLVSGLGAHNLTRNAWYWAPGLMVAAAACRREP